MAQPGVVAPWRATYVPGDWYLIAGPTSLVVLEPGSGRGEMIADLWSDVVASASMSDLVDRLAGYGITELPDLAVVFWSQAGMRTLVRGGVQLVDPESNQPIASGEGIVTWNEVGLDDVTKARFRLRGQTPEGELLPLSVGVVRVGAISVSAEEDAVVRSPQPLLRSAPASGTASVGESSGAGVAGSPVAGSPGSDTASGPAEGLAGEAVAGAVLAGAAGGGAAGTGAAGSGAAEAGAAAGDDADGDDSFGGDGDAGTAGDGDAGTGAAASAGADDRIDSDHGREPVQSDDAGRSTGSAGSAVGADIADDDTGPDFPPLDSEGDDELGQTGASPGFGLDSPWGPQPGAAAGQFAGAVGLGGAAAAAGGSALAGGGAGAAGAGAGAAAGGAAAAGVAGAGLGAGAATVGSSALSPVAPGGGGAQSAGTVEFTVGQFEMENDDTQLMDSAGAPDGPPGGDRGAAGGPLVEAVLCPNGHSNAPGSSVCRVCRAPITPGPPQLIPPPLLARLRAADGTVVDLDRAVLLGRAPSEQRSTVPLPRLVALASPAQDISRTHLQVVPENWQVVVTDLHSTNGTFVTDPGPNGNRGLLPPGQPIPVPIGATLELGEGVTITVEAVD